MSGPVPAPEKFEGETTTSEQRTKFIGRMAVTGGESGIVGVIIAAFPIMFLGSAFMGDAAIPVMLLAHGLLLGHYLARKLTRDAGFTPEQARVLRIAPPVALIAGFLAMDWYRGMIFDPLPRRWPGSWRFPRPGTDRRR